MNLRPQATNQTQEAPQAYLAHVATLSSNPTNAIKAPLPSLLIATSEVAKEARRSQRKATTLHGIRELSSPLSD